MGSSVVLYLEDDYQEPDSIPASSVYFVAEEPKTTDTGNGARVYATNTVKVNNDDYFDRDKNDIAIRVLVPDMCTNATTVCEGPNGLRYGQTVTVVFESDSGIKNPSEEKSGGYKTGYTTLGPTDSIPGMGKFTPLSKLNVWAKIKLSKVKGKRGDELTVTGSAFNNGTTASVYVLGQPAPGLWHRVSLVGDAGLRGNGDGDGPGVRR